MTPQDVKDLAVDPALVSPWLGFVVPRDAQPTPAPRPVTHLPKAA